MNSMTKDQCSSKEIKAFLRWVVMPVNYFFLSGKDPWKLIGSKNLGEVNSIFFLQISQQRIFILAIKDCLAKELIHSKLRSIFFRIMFLEILCITIRSLFNSSLLISNTARRVSRCDNLVKSSFTENRIHWCEYN